MLIQTSQRAELFRSAFRIHILWVFVLFVCVLSASLMQPARAAASTSNTINFQARLETAAGAIVPDGNYNVEFKLYSVATLGSAEWTEDYTYNSGPGSTDVRLRVANGYLTANLGSITAFPGTINWNQQQWLTMNIGGTVSSGTITWDGEMSPRLQLTAVPYAFAAGTLSTTDGSGDTGTLSFGTVTNNPVITLPNASGTVCLQSSSACGFATGSGTAFLQGGNSFGAQGVLGTNDSNSLAIRTNNTNKLVIDTSGNLQLQQASTFNIASASGGSQLTIQAGANSTAAGTGGTLLLQGGAPGTTGASGSVIVKANTNDSTTAFEVQNAAGTTTLFNADTSNLRVTVAGDIVNTFTSGLGLTQVSATTTYATNPRWVAVQGRYAYVVEQGGTAALETLNIANPSAPERVGTLNLAKASPSQIQVVGHYAYIAEQGASSAGVLEIVDVSNPNSPTSTTIVPVASGGPFGVYVSGRYAYVVDANTNDLAIVDVSNPAIPTVVSVTAVNTSPRKVYVVGNYAYVASFGGTPKLQILNVSNPASPSIVGALNLTDGGDDVSVEGKYAYVTEYGAALQVINISNPASPASVYSGGGSYDSYANVLAGRYLISDGYNYANNLGITDVTNPTAPSNLQTYTTGMNEPAGMALSGRYLYVANQSGNNLIILDISGLETTAATIHSLEAGSLTIDTNANLGGDVSVQGGLTVGGASQLGGSLGVNGAATFASSTNSTTAFQVQNASGSSLFTVDTSGDNVNVATAALAGTVTIGNGTGASNVTLDTGTGGVNIGTNGIANTIQIGNTSGAVTQAINIGTNSTASSTNDVTIGSTVAGSLKLQGSGIAGTITGNGVTWETSSNSTTAFQVQNSSSNQVFAVDTMNNQAILGKSGTLSGQLLFNTSAGASTVTLGVGSTSSSYSILLPTAGGSASQCLQLGGGGGSQLQWGACGTASTGLAKNATDSSSASVSASSFLYTFTNSNTTTAGSVLKLDNGSNTANVLEVDGTGNPQVGSAYIFAKNSNASPSGQLLSLQNNVSSGTQVFGVSTTGSVSIQTTTNSTTALQLQNSSGTAVLTINDSSSPATIQVGSSTPNANAILLVLNSYNIATDPAGTNGAMYYNTSTNTFRCYENGIWKNCISTPNNASVADQSIGASTTAYLTNSNINIPSSGVQAGTTFDWRITMTKTAAGTAVNTFDIRFGTSGTTADTSRCSFNQGTQTAVADTAVVELTVTVRSVGSSATIACNYRMTHDLASTGFDNTLQTQTTDVTSGTFDDTVANSIMGVSYTTGAGYSITVQQVQVTTTNL
jgi:hypothetical protein